MDYQQILELVKEVSKAGLRILNIQRVISALP